MGDETDLKFMEHLEIMLRDIGNDIKVIMENSNDNRDKKSRSSIKDSKTGLTDSETVFNNNNLSLNVSNNQTNQSNTQSNHSNQSRNSHRNNKGDDHDYSSIISSNKNVRQGQFEQIVEEQDNIHGTTNRMKARTASVAKVKRDSQNYTENTCMNNFKNKNIKNDKNIDIDKIKSNVTNNNNRNILNFINNQIRGSNNKNHDIRGDNSLIEPSNSIERKYNTSGNFPRRMNSSMNNAKIANFSSFSSDEDDEDFYKKKFSKGVEDIFQKHGKKIKKLNLTIENLVKCELN